ncbi:MAG: hypothetical protein ACLSGT_06630, partial [Oscillospiraceae bacterium]
PLGGSEAAPGTKISLDINSDSTSQPTQSNVTIDQFKAELDLQVGETFDLADTLQYSGSAASIVWSSSNPSIALLTQTAMSSQLPLAQRRSLSSSAARQPPAM